LTGTLLVKTHAFGDALLATPAARGLVEAGDRVTVLAGPSSLPVWSRFPGLAGVETAPSPPIGIRGALRLALWTLLRPIRFRRFDRVVYLGRSPLVRRWLRALCRSPMRSGGDSPLGPWETTFPQAEGELASSAFARMAGVRPDTLRPSFPVGAREAEAAGKRLGGGEWLAVFPGGGDNPRDSVREKRWHSAGYAEVCRAVMDRGLRVLLMGGPADVRAAEEVERAVPGVINLAGRTGWGETAALILRAGRFLGADSGPAHLATAVGARTVVLFGPTSPECLYAPGLVTAVRSTASCAPCYANMPFPGCPRQDGCMQAIAPEEVLEALGPMLPGGAG
jgi:ADP-heptose:LPS heptosyltransferase